MSLTAQLNVTFRASQIGAGDLGTPKAETNLNGQIVWANGSGAGQAQKIFSDEHTLAASATENLDLASALTDLLGNTLTFATVKAIIIQTSKDNPGALTFGGAASNGVAMIGDSDGDTDDVDIVEPNSISIPFAISGAGRAVTASTGDILKVAAAATAGNYTYKIVILGT